MSSVAEPPQGGEFEQSLRISSWSKSDDCILVASFCLPTVALSRTTAFEHPEVRMSDSPVTPPSPASPTVTLSAKAPPFDIEALRQAQLLVPQLPTRPTPTTVHHHHHHHGHCHHGYMTLSATSNAALGGGLHHTSSSGPSSDGGDSPSHTFSVSSHATVPHGGIGASSHNTSAASCGSHGAGYAAAPPGKQPLPQRCYPPHSTRGTYYDHLNIKRTATRADVDAAYRRWRNGGYKQAQSVDPLRADAVDRVVVEATLVLLSENLRAQYDQQLLYIGM